jgi:hypothetical protein
VIRSALPPTVGGMASKGLRAISYQGTRKVEAGYNPSHTNETLIGYTACWLQFFIFFFSCLSIPFVTYYSMSNMSIY